MKLSQAVANGLQTAVMTFVSVNKQVTTGFRRLKPVKTGFRCPSTRGPSSPGNAQNVEFSKFVARKSCARNAFKHVLALQTVVGLAESVFEKF